MTSLRQYGRAKPDLCVVGLPCANKSVKEIIIMKKRFTSVFLSLCLAFSAVAVCSAPASAAPAESGEAVSAAGDALGKIRGGAVLHCFNWSYQTIIDNLPDIAAAGYSAVQTSPVQNPKDYDPSWTGTSAQWWKMYQPLSLRIAEGDETWLGSPDDLESLCTAADAYNIKVVVDIVANHLGNNGTDGGTYAYLSPDVDEDLKDPSYFHTNNIKVNYNSRYNITQYHLGMPDLNTGNEYIQQSVLQLLKDCVDLGVDGFRFDAAKHIETPTDAQNFRSNFWSVVCNGIKAYSPNVFIYGEILGTAGPNFGISNYTTYMNVTDDATGNDALSAVRGNNASSLASPTYQKGCLPKEAVLWAESHDTYMDNSTSGVSNANIMKAWAITGARADSTSLYLARPGSTMGLAGDDNWKNDIVTQINRFKNRFDGTSEYLASSGSTAYIERGTSGVSIAKLNGGGDVELTAHIMSDGVYTDQITGNLFTVSNGKIRGTVGSSGIAVVYDAGGLITNTVGDVDADGEISIKDATMIQKYLVELTTLNATQLKAADTNGDGNVTVDDATLIQYYLAEFNITSNIGKSIYDTQSSTQPTTSNSVNTGTYTMVFTNSQRWTGTISCYYWSSSNTSMVQWPGKQMSVKQQSNDYGETVYTVDIPAAAQNVIFTNGTSQTVDIPTTGSGNYYAMSTTTNGKYNVGTW